MKRKSSIFNIVMIVSLLIPTVAIAAEIEYSHPNDSFTPCGIEKSKKDIRTVLEVGCGTGVYPIKHKELFQDKSYTGIDISKENIEYCKKKSKFDFECGDFIKMN
ncbi:MAG: hypothetical protein COB34_01265, partial [Methylophilaceae bacterium]